MPDLTQNIGLKKPLDNETADIAVINENMDIIDAEIAKKASITQDGRMAKEDKQKLDAIEEGATNYIHPSSHPANIIIQDSTHKFVSDIQIANWDGKLEQADIDLLAGVGRTTETVKKNADDISNLDTQMADLETNKVDKVTGKGLSTEDYTTTEKTKLAGINQDLMWDLIADITLETNTLEVAVDVPANTYERIKAIVTNGKANETSGKSMLVKLNGSALEILVILNASTSSEGAMCEGNFIVDGDSGQTFMFVHGHSDSDGSYERFGYYPDIADITEILFDAYSSYYILAGTRFKVLGIRK